MIERATRILRRAAACAAAIAMLVVLGGCMQATRATPVRHFGLGPPPATAAAEAATHRRAGAVLELARIDAPEWLTGTAMVYRLAYRGDHALAAYANSDWIAPPTALLAPVLRGALVGAGGWRAVLGPDGPATADAMLKLRLDDFSQVFQSTHRSDGVIVATATLIDVHAGRVLAQRRFVVASAAPTPDAPGGVLALATASRELGRELAEWTHAIDAPPAPRD